MKDPQHRAFGVQDSDSSRPDQFLRFLVPTTTALFDLLVGMAVLIVSQPVPAASAMFDQQDLPVCFADPSHFPKGGDGIEEGTGRERRNDSIERIIGEIERLRPAFT
jgi:hypothetical protein